MEVWGHWTHVSVVFIPALSQHLSLGGNSGLLPGLFMERTAKLLLMGSRQQGVLVNCISLSVSRLSLEKKFRGAWVAQWVKWPTSA